MDDENNQEAEQPFFDSTYISLKCILGLSIILIILDFCQIIFLFHLLSDYSTTIPLEIFNQCYKYQKITDIFFALFGLSCGVSAAFYSIALLLNEDYFHVKLLQVFIHFNYYLFGPFLLGMCCLGLYYFEKIAFSCKSNDIKVKSVNFTTLLCLLFSLSMATMVSALYAIISSLDLLSNSIRFTNEGNNILGKLFWLFVMNRNRSPSEVDLMNNDISNRDNNSNSNSVIQQEQRNLIII